MQKELKLLTLTLPIFFELLLMNIVGNVDIYMIGKFDINAVGAIGGLSQVLYIQNIFFSFICLGTTILISQYIGAKKNNKIEDIIRTSLIMSFIFAVFIGGSFAIFNNFILHQLRLPNNLILLSKNYFTLVGGLCIFQAITLTNSAVMKSYGFASKSLYINIGINIINIIGNGIFIFGWLGGPILGVTGIGISTVFSRFVGMVISYFIMCKCCNFKFRKKRFSFKILKKIISIGIPTAGENVSFAIAQIIILIFVNSMGSDAITTRTYLRLITSFITIFSISLGQGTAILVGRLIGSKEYDKVYYKCLKSTVTSLGLALILSIGLYLLKSPIMSLFTNDINVKKIAATVFIWIIFVETGRTFNIIIINSLHASGDIKFPVIAGLFSMFGIAVPLSYLFSIRLEYGLAGIWIANGCDEWFRALLMLYRWLSKKWMNKGFV